MKPAAFTDIVAHAYGIETKTVNLFARILREAGLLTSGGRGRHAPHMQPSDAARITITLLATDKPARAIDQFEKFRNLIFSNRESVGAFPSEYSVVEGATLEKVLTNYFSTDLQDEQQLERIPSFEVQDNEPRAALEFSDDNIRNCAIFSRKENQRLMSRQTHTWHSGIRQTRRLPSRAMAQLIIPFYGERLDGKAWEEISANIADTELGKRNYMQTIIPLEGTTARWSTRPAPKKEEFDD